jgi:alanine-synthesizing transaminase
MEFAKDLLIHAKVAVSPGIGFGEYGEGYVRVALVENEHRIRQAARNVKKFLQAGTNMAPSDPEKGDRPGKSKKNLASAK